jgi:hypothetical protein
MDYPELPIEKSCYDGPDLFISQINLEDLIILITARLPVNAHFFYP